MAAPQPVANNYSQPTLPLTKSGWAINALDYQIVTKSSGWNQGQTARLNEFQAGLDININYAAIAVPYDDATKYGNYVTDARTKGLKIIHRSHWDGWQGDNGSGVTVGRQQYLDDMYDFIVAHPSFYADYDVFGACVEANNADNSSNYTFRTPETAGGSFDYTKYNQFLKDQVRYANAAFTAIGKNVATWAVSHSLSNINLAGQTLDSNDTGNSNGLTNSDIVTYFGGILSIDHYLSDSYRYGDATKYWDRFSSDLDKIHLAFPDCKIMISEWGYHTTTTIPESERAGMYRGVIDVLRTKSYIYGVSFWNHMGQTSSSVFTDNSGTIVTEGLLTPKEVKRAFTTGNRAYGMRVRV